ncbi:MAG TPA: HAMP domain-containing protein [Thermodesulfobacteriota bacterium]|nr:HAMP domain-containing protein [Thermodesulfobacteriota bacterium]
MRSLRSKISLQMLIVGVAPVLILGAVVYVELTRQIGTYSQKLATSYQVMEAQVVGANLANAARAVVAEIDAYLLERIKDVRAWAREPLVVEAAVRADQMRAKLGWPAYPDIARDAQAIQAIERRMRETRALDPVPRATAYLKDQLAQSRVFREVFFTDRNGYNAAVSNLTSDFVQSDEEWWVRAWEDGIYIGRVGFDQSANVFSIDIHVRIDDPATDRPVGVMKAVLDIGAVQTIASRKAAEIKDSDVKVFKSDGLLLADTSVGHSPKFVMRPEGNLLARKYRPAELALQPSGKPGYLLGRSEFFGTRPAVEQVIGYARSGGAEVYQEVPNFAGFGWGAVVAQRRATAFAPIEPLATLEAGLREVHRALVVVVIGIALLAAVASALTGVLIARGVTRPVLELARVADRISLGDLDAAIRVRSRDEIGTLAESIERMRTSLKAAIERMRARRVAETAAPGRPGPAPRG